MNRVRFAPSPTGYLHIGSARTALFNYLFARSTKGKFLVRVEDTDKDRSTEESTRSILDGLKWLGFEPDEEIIFQSGNAGQHRAAALRLLEEGKAYRDFTPKGDVSDSDVKARIAERAREQGAEKDLRDNPYRDLDRSESDRRADAGEPFAVRLRVSEEGNTAFEDSVYGLQERDHSEIEDLVLLRSDGHPLYNLAVVCDDLEMGITHVIRGQDHLTNTHKQILIYKALGEEPPQFAHLPLILAPGGKKLSKRHHGEIVSLTTYRDKGFVAGAFRNFLALLGWSPKSEQEIMDLAALVDTFSLEGINRSNAVFNFDANNPRRWTDDKALWMNAEYIRTMPLDKLIPLVREELRGEKLWREEYDDEEKGWFEAVITVIRERYFTLKDFSEQGRAFFSEDFDHDPAAVKKHLAKKPELEQWLPEFADRLESLEDFSHDPIYEAANKFCEDKEIKLGVLLNGARVVVTGQAVGPSMITAFELLGRDRSVMRLRSKIAWNE
ncbi:MAG: glutamate--tRNA ligase [Acidobacteria bacterium]|nr:MAG: glutamate--tRNA ligase [Acidobacteriota bacterium]REK02943.1 MAG: glutamate--tRNA ligase [Acidobacteriota bacterium]REK13253.1 MAG: glutamate--tRNA ligase [Acidobacteriota bacterium]REK41247.1 MAG: glutamate--tRNA ligase [Acidobacteriota bacterium]